MSAGDEAIGKKRVTREFPGKKKVVGIDLRLRCPHDITRRSNGNLRRVRGLRLMDANALRELIESRDARNGQDLLESVGGLSQLAERLSSSLKFGLLTEESAARNKVLLLHHVTLNVVDCFFFFCNR